MEHGEIVAVEKVHWPAFEWKHVPLKKKRFMWSKAFQFSKAACIF